MLKGICYFDEQKYKEERNIIENLIYATNISSLSIGSIDFYQEVYKIEGFNVFATFQQPHELLTFTDDNYLFWFSEEEGQQELITKSMDEFLVFLEYYQKLYSIFVNYKEVNLDTLNQLKSLAGMEKRFIRDVISEFKNMMKT